MLAFMWIAAAAIIILVAIAAARKLSKPRPVRLVPYGELRRQAIKDHGDPHAVRPDPPPRPPGLDTRLAASKADALAAAIKAEGSAPVSLDGTMRAAGDALLDLMLEIYESLESELKAIDPTRNWYELLSPARRAWLLAWQVDGEVHNGGFDQYYLNSSGDGAADAPEAFRLFGHPQAAAIIERCNAVFPAGPPRDSRQRLAAMGTLPESAAAIWSAADSEYYDLARHFEHTACFGASFILAHRDEFFKNE